MRDNNNDHQDQTRINDTVLSRRHVLSLTGAAVAAATFGLSPTARAQDKIRRGGTLRISALTNPSSLDPATGGAGTDHSFLYPLYDTLTEWDFATLAPKPGLAQKWSYPDPTTMVLDLHPGVKFHDGTVMDAEAVKFNLVRSKTDARSNIKTDLASVESVRVTGPLQVTLKLNVPDAALPGILADRAGMMVSPKALQDGGGALNRAPVGTGGYTFVSWTDNNRLVYKRNANYWKPERPYLDGIELSIISELATGLRSVTAGQNDFIYHLPPRQRAILDRAKTLKVVSGPTTYCAQLYLNWGRPPFDNVKVRQAVNFAVDREAYLKATYAGIGEPAYMNLPSSHWGYDADTAKLYRHDPDKARKLLAEAGYKDGLTVEFAGYNDGDSVQRQEVLIEQFRKAGINLRFFSGPIPEISAAYFGAEKKGAGLLAAWTGRPDPSMSYALMYGKNAYFNAGRADVPAGLDDAIKASRATEDLAIRKRELAKVQRIVMEHALVVPLAFQFELNAMNKKVMGYQPNLLGKPKYENVWLAE